MGESRGGHLQRTMLPLQGNKDGMEERRTCTHNTPSRGPETPKPHQPHPTPATTGESVESGVGTPGGGVAHRGRLLEGDADAAARGVFDGLFGLVVELVVLQTVTGRVAGG